MKIVERFSKYLIAFIFIFALFSFFILFGNFCPIHLENYANADHISSYIQQFQNKEHQMFPFRYFSDTNNNVLPFVAVTGPFRDDAAKQRYYEYKEKGVHVFGITAYKSFPNNKMFGNEEGEYERNDDFNYVENIKDWLCCFKDKDIYGFSIFNNIVDISESDFYDAEDTNENPYKKYDFIYICNKDDDTCPLNGWNAINRNFDLALKCFPVLCNEFHLKGLVVGRVGCGLEKEYGNKLEVLDWLDWHVLQGKMRESKILFVPNIFDASPRVIAECITKDVPVLMNRDILCGSKYVNYETGEFFSDENDLKGALTNLLNRIHKISPKRWWEDNYSQEKSQRVLHDFLADAFPGSLENVSRVKFIL